MVQTKKIDDRVEIIFEARECVVAAFYDSLAAGSVVRHRLALIQHFISRLLQQPDQIRRFQRVNLHDFEIVNMA